MGQPTVFLDRDGTLVIDPGFIDHPDKVQLVPGAAESVKRFRNAGFKVVIASNQSGIARGYFDEDQLARIHERMNALLADDGATIDAIYYCPYLDGPDATVEAYRKNSQLRKPAPGMLLKAAAEHDLDLSQSWMIGDAPRDIEAGNAAGCRTILLAPPDATMNGSPVTPTHHVATLLDAAAIVEQHGPDTTASASVDNPTLPVLNDIRDLLDRQLRHNTHEDFSLAKLIATLVQLLTIVIVIWGVTAAVDGQNEPALIRLVLAVVLQLAVISIILFTRK